MVKSAAKDLIVKTVLRLLGNNDCLIFLFGSQLNKVVPPSSDIDVGLLCREKIDGHKLALIKNEIAEKAKTLRKIDIIDFRRVDDPVFLENTLRRIKIWHQTRPSKTYLNNLMQHLNA